MQGHRLRVQKFSKELPTLSHMIGQGALPPPPQTSALKHPENSPLESQTKQKSKSVSFLDTAHLPKLVGNPLREWLGDTVSLRPNIEIIAHG